MRSPHEDTVIEASSQPGEIHRGVEKGGVGVMACEWTQCGQGSGRAGDPSAAALSLGAQPNVSQSQSKSGRSVEELQAEIRRLQAENAKLLEQREVLKKSLGTLSEAPPRGMPASNK